MPIAKFKKAELVSIARTLVARLSLSPLRATLDDTGILVHVIINAPRIKKNPQFTGPISRQIKQLLPKDTFKEVIEVMLPPGTKTPLLNGTVALKGGNYVWTLEPLSSTLIVRSTHDGAVKDKKNQ